MYYATERFHRLSYSFSLVQPFAMVAPQSPLPTIRVGVLVAPWHRIHQRCALSPAPPPPRMGRAGRHADRQHAAGDCHDPHAGRPAAHRSRPLRRVPGYHDTCMMYNIIHAMYDI